jgi:hypothetical protein
MIFFTAERAFSEISTPSLARGRDPYHLRGSEAVYSWLLADVGFPHLQKPAGSGFQRDVSFVVR